VVCDWQLLTLSPAALAFTWCQVPVIYRLDDENKPGIVVAWDDGEESSLDGLALPADISTELFQRSHRVRRLTVTFGSGQLLAD